MKIVLSILLTVLITGCASSYSGFSIRDSGDKVYRGSSSTSFVYMNGYYGFPYYGPYAWRWYYPYWYSPLDGPHYSWYRPYGNWGGPCLHCSAGYAHSKVSEPSPVGSSKSRPGAIPVLPVDLKQMAVPNSMLKPGMKHHAYRTPQMKSRSMAKYGTSKSVSHSTARSSSGLRHPGSVPRSSGMSNRSLGPTGRQIPKNPD